MLLQKNRQAERESMSYIHTLDRSESILCDLRVGDKIQLLACACFPGWSNTVEEATIEIWGIDTLGEEQYLDEQILTPEPTSKLQIQRGQGKLARGFFKGIQYLAAFKA